MWIEPEINDPRPGAILCVGNSPGKYKCIGGRGDWLLGKALKAGGINRQSINIACAVGTQPIANNFRAHSANTVQRGLRNLDALVRRLKPSILVSFGNEASFACVDGWPARNSNIFGATGIIARRGYVWESRWKIPCLTTLHPYECLINRDPSGLNAQLLSWDLIKANRLKGMVKGGRNLSQIRPKRNVTVITSARDAERAKQAIAKAKLVACDIECFDEATTSAIGFGISARSWVFPRKFFAEANEILQDASIKKIFQNGQFDVYHLLSRDGVRVRGSIHDTIIQWHCLFPEFAGAATRADGKRGSKRTHKSLHFLASVATFDEWWKDYEFASDYEMYTLNGRDCSVTYDVYKFLAKQLDDHKCQRIYEHERKLLWPCVEIHNRGLAVDSQRRTEAIILLEEERTRLLKELRSLAKDLFEEKRNELSKPHLVWKQETCSCCRGGKKQKEACWNCAGLDSKSKKPALQMAWASKYSDLTQMPKTVAGLKEDLLGQCRVCKGVGKWEVFDPNFNSDDVRKMLVYECLRLPKRMKKGKLTTDEEALKSLLGAI